jgi:hypothetical protein
MAYSILLFAFAGGHRTCTGPSDDDVLRWFSVMWEGSGPKAWDAGSYDEWGEWESTRDPFGLIANDERSEAVNARSRFSDLGPAVRDATPARTLGGARAVR